MHYRRANIKGGTYFFTVNLAERNKTLLTDKIELLRKVLNKVKKQHPFQLNAMVILPDHLHVLLTLPLDEHDYSTRLALIKANFSRQIPKEERINKSRKSKGERGIGNVDFGSTLSVMNWIMKIMLITFITILLNTNMLIKQ